MDAIRQESPLPRVVMGISVGATIAAFAGQATLNGVALYSRQLIMNPMIDAANWKQAVSHPQPSLVSLLKIVMTRCAACPTVDAAVLCVLTVDAAVLHVFP